MSPKEKFDACMKQADFYNQKVYNRQGYQWKVTIGLWTVLIAGTAFLLSGRVPPNCARIATVPLWFYLVVLIGYTFIWVRWVANSNTRDQKVAHHFADEARKLIFNDSDEVAPLVKDPPSTERNLCSYFRFLRIPAHLFEVGATALILWVIRSLLKAN